MYSVADWVRKGWWQHFFKFTSSCLINNDYNHASFRYKWLLKAFCIILSNFPWFILKDTYFHLGLGDMGQRKDIFHLLCFFLLLNCPHKKHLKWEVKWSALTFSITMQVLAQPISKKMYGKSYKMLQWFHVLPLAFVSCLDAY